MSKFLVEDTIKLRLNHFPKKILTRLDSGEFLMMFGLNPVKVKYSVREVAGIRMIDIEYSKGINIRRQTIRLDSQEITFGKRPYFLCGSCGHKRTNMLYLRPDRIYFACRECNDLTYELCTLNKKIYENMVIYISRTVLHFREMILMCGVYAGKKTKRTLRFETRLNRWLNNKKVRQVSGVMKQKAY